ncbi:hypothetical protein Gotri_023474 [Gossypium trilobum]|uniref:Uncharacterized protein n=1 Tax=Gossypium trilobum TaxID=34281 RepID=A0A7J9DJ26_9ROSI|nr:hypothetical protein [Gossypium trilobum]
MDQLQGAWEEVGKEDVTGLRLTDDPMSLDLILRRLGWFSFSRNGRLQITRIPLRWLIFAYVNVVLKVTFWYQFHFVVEIGRKL